MLSCIYTPSRAPDAILLSGATANTIVITLPRSNWKIYSYLKNNYTVASFLFPFRTFGRLSASCMAQTTKKRFE